MYARLRPIGVPVADRTNYWGRIGGDNIVGSKKFLIWIASIYIGILTLPKNMKNICLTFQYLERL